MNPDMALQSDEMLEPLQDEGAIELRPEVPDRNERLDKFIATQLEEYSRGFIQLLIDQGAVLVDGRVRTRTFKMTPGQVVTVRLPEPEVEELLPESIPLTIVYEDTDVVV